MTIPEMNKALPARYQKMKEEQHIDSVLRFEARGIHALQPFKTHVQNAYKHARQGFTNRYIDPAEEYYGRGVMGPEDILIYLFPCVTLRDYERLKFSLEIARGVTGFCAGFEITKL